MNTTAIHQIAVRMDRGTWFPTITATIAVIWRQVDALPSIVGLQFTRPVINNRANVPRMRMRSQLIMIIGTQFGNRGAGHRLSEESIMHETISTSLSAKGSK